MSISGSSIHKKIKTQINEVEEQSEILERELYQIEKTLTSLTAKREDCYVHLAFHYLPELDAKAVQSTLREVRMEVEGVFKEKQEKRNDLERLMKENRKTNKKLEEKLEITTTQITQLSQQRDNTAELIFQDLQKNAKYAQINQEAKKSEARLQQNKNRIEEIERESEKKLPAFEQNKLFSYLIKVDYGTIQYQRNGLRKRLDSWVAEKVDFDKNKKCYDFLKSMPELMKQEVERKQKELDAVVAEMKGIESEAEKEHGLPKIISQAEKLIAQKKELIVQDKEQDAQYAVYTKYREEIDGKKDSYHLQAVQHIKDFLKGQQIVDLKTMARQTRGTEDDVLVDEIEGIDTKVRELKDKSKSVKSERNILSKRLEGIKDIDQRFRSKNYDGGRSTFKSGFDIDELLTGYVLGQRTTGDINSEIDHYQHTTPAPTYRSSSDYHSSDYSSGSGYSSPSSDSFSSGGGFSGGGFSSGSGF